jgi:hypothetical protein
LGLVIRDFSFIDIIGKLLPGEVVTDGAVASHRSRNASYEAFFSVAPPDRTRAPHGRAVAPRRPPLRGADWLYSERGVILSTRLESEKQITAAARPDPFDHTNSHGATQTRLS